MVKIFIDQKFKKMVVVSKHYFQQGGGVCVKADCLKKDLGL